MAQEEIPTYKVGFETGNKYLTELNLQPLNDVFNQTYAKDYALTLKNTYYDLVDKIIRENVGDKDADQLFNIRVLIEAFEEIALTERRGE